MEDKISVIVPVFNAELFIKSCIKAILCQSYSNFEVLFIDDGSSDKTGGLLDEAAAYDDRLKVIHQENHGVSFARNIGLKHAVGKYVVFVDADDTIDAEYLKKLLKAIQLYDVGIAVCGYNQTDLKGHVIKHSDFGDAVINSTDIIERMLSFRDITSALWNKIFIMDIIRKNHIFFDDKFKIGEDMVFLTKYSMYISKGNVISDRLYNYTSNPSGAMLSKKVEFNSKWITEWNAVNEVEHLLQKKNIHSDMLIVKKVRIADKLLSNLMKLDVHENDLQKELQNILKKNLIKICFASDFNVKKKISCIFNAISPKIKSKLN